MAPRKVVTVGLEIGSEGIDQIPFNSTNTLLDWDLVVFLPDISSMISHRDTYQGKTSLYEDESFRLKERCEHWRREIKGAVDAGRTVICYLPSLKELWVDSGKREYSGTGRNQRTTRLLEPYSNYACIPLDVKPRNAEGKAMKLSSRAESLASYWSMFGDASEFAVVLDGAALAGPVQTRIGDHTVGGIFNTNSGGNLVLLPMIEFYADEYFTEGDDGSAEFNAHGRELGAKLHSAWLGIDSALRNETELTPAPRWAEGALYILLEESTAKADLLEAEEALSVAQRNKEEAADKVREAGALRALLFEKGPPLENAIIKALQILNFSAVTYKENDSEFDVIFECSEGRLLGEAEGKDNKAVNVDKLRQLAMNIHEDLAREEVEVAAKPVLFGNGYRLQDPEQRPGCFTEKCITAAKSSSTALVATIDLFVAAKSVIENGDQAFASQCRQAILNGSGPVIFPLANAVWKPSPGIEAAAVEAKPRPVDAD